MKRASVLVLISGYIAAAATTAAYADGQALTENAITKNTKTENTLIAESHAEVQVSPRFTDEQLEKIHAVRTKYGDGNAVRMAELEKLRHQIFDGLGQQTVDKSQVLALQGKINELEAAAGIDRAQMMIEMHDILSPEQRQQMRRHMLTHEGPGFGSERMPHPGGFGWPMPGFGPPGLPMMPPPGGGPDFRHGKPGPSCDL